MLGIDKAKPILRASIDGLNQGKFTEGHELDRKWRVPKAIVGRRLTQGLLLSTTACRDKVLEAAINNKVRACHSPTYGSALSSTSGQSSLAPRG